MDPVKEGQFISSLLTVLSAALQGMVVEFVQSAPSVLVLQAVHALQLDARPSKGRLGTFTERWADFVEGSGPAPAVQPSSKRHFAPALLRRTSGCVCLGQGGEQACDQVWT